MSKFEEKVIDKIRSRAEVGKKKYGTTMEREDRLTHLQEELMDAAVYVERLIEDTQCPIHGLEDAGCPYCRRLRRGTETLKSD
jgi:hypothetical protein